MPFGTMQLQPGVNTDATPTLNKAGVSECDLIRYRDGLVEKLGGWDEYYASSIGSTVRALHPWQDLQAVKRLAVGAESSLSYIYNGARTDITPCVSSFNLAINQFSSTNGSSIVTISYPGINAAVGDIFSVVYPVAVGQTILLSGAYSVVTGGANSFTIDTGTTATFSGNGDFCSLSCTSSSPNITCNFVSGTFTFPSVLYIGQAFAIGGLTLLGTYVTSNVAGATAVITASGNATSSASGTLGVRVAGVTYCPAFLYRQSANVGAPITTTDWCLANWGEVLLANPKDGAIYSWNPSAPSTAAKVVSANAPSIARGIFISMPSQILVAYGCSGSGQYWQDPLLVRWCDAGNYTSWTASATNQAGSYRIPSGSIVVGGLQGPQQGILWTDIDVWGMQYQGPPLVFGFNKLSTGCGLIAQHAAVQLGTNIYWMSQKQFFRMDGNGNVQPMPCTVWDQVFQDLDADNAQVIRAAANSQFSEVTWYFPTASDGSGENVKYVKFNTLFGTWDYGNLARSAWTDQSVLGSPIGADPEDDMLYQHEVSTNAAGEPLVSSFRTGWFEIGEGEDMIFLDWLLPDFKWGTVAGDPNAQIRVTVYVAKYPGSEVFVSGPFTVTNTTPALGLRARGRLVSLEFESADLNSFWRLGACKYRFRPDGRN